MRTLLKNAAVINVFTDKTNQANVLITDDRIIGIGDYSDCDADISEDLTGKFISPAFIDGHIHIESTMLMPDKLAATCVVHGTSGLIADPHEIANVCGKNGIDFMLEASRSLPLDFYFMMPSCVPATPFDEAGAILNSNDLAPYYDRENVLGLAEMMNYPGVLNRDSRVMAKISDARRNNLKVNGHAPLLSGKMLDSYISSGIQDDHECSTLDEALEKLGKGQWIMIREGTSAKNLKALLPLFDEPYSRRCLLVTDDKHPFDLLKNGHIDSIIREAVNYGKSAITGIRMATIQAAQCFDLQDIGAVAPGYKADLLVLNDLQSLDICDVYHNGIKVVSNKKIINFKSPEINPKLYETICNSFHIKELNEKDFYIEPHGNKCRVIKVIPNQLLTDEWITDIDFSNGNGIDTKRDILKLAVCERHKSTNHIGLGFISGIGLKSGAIASSVSHDSHNLIIIGTNETDMTVAANHIRKIGGGNVLVVDGMVVADLPLPIAGLMSPESVTQISLKNENLRNSVKSLSVSEGVEPFMNMAFVSLPVIPSLKMTTLGLINVNNQELVSLFV